jgi:hypothetical protein
MLWPRRVRVGVMEHLERAGFDGPAESAQQLAAGRVQVLVVVEVEAVDDLERLLG